MTQLKYRLVIPLYVKSDEYGSMFECHILVGYLLCVLYLCTGDSHKSLACHLRVSEQFRGTILKHYNATDMLVGIQWSHGDIATMFCQELPVYNRWPLVRGRIKCIHSCTCSSKRFGPHNKGWHL